MNLKPHPLVVAAQRRFRRLLAAGVSAVVLAGVALWGCAAFAQAAADPAAPVVSHADALLLVNAAKEGKWLLVVAALLVVVMRFVRGPLVGMLPAGKVKDALSSTVGGWLTNILGSVFASFVTAGVAGVAIDLVAVVNIVLGAVVASLTAAGAHQAIKDATAKGDAASTAIDTKAAALAQLPKP